jgi:P27 family predicted phage terminase small subunit
MPGPRPTPTRLKILRGNPRGKPLNKHEPKPAGDLKDAPPHFTPELRAIWEYAITNVPPGLLKKIDQSILEQWATAHYLHRCALTELLRSGTMTVKSTKDTDMPSPYLRALNEQSLIMMRAMDHLGFSPASRSRITTGDTTSSFGAWEDVSA